MKLSLMDWYIGRTVFGAMVVVTLCGGMLMFVFTLIDAMQDTSGEGAFADAIWRTLRTMPRKVEEIAPFAVFLGALIGLGSLSSNSELTVLRSAGVSILRLFLSACIPSVLMILLAQTMIPILFAADERDAQSQVAGVSKAWLREGDTFTQIGSIDVDENLSDIRQFNIGKGQLRRKLEAQRATQIPDGSGWELHSVNEESYDSRGYVSLTTSDQGTWSTPRSAESLTTLFTTEPRKMSLLQLYVQIQDLEEANRDASEFLIEFWMKLTKPLSVLGLVLIAVAFVVGSTREIGLGARLTFGIAIGFVFHYLQTLIAPMSVVFEIPPVVAILIPLILVWVVGGVLIRRIG